MEYCSLENRSSLFVCNWHSRFFHTYGRLECDVCKVSKTPVAMHDLFSYEYFRRTQVLSTLVHRSISLTHFPLQFKFDGDFVTLQFHSWFRYRFRICYGSTIVVLRPTVCSDCFISIRVRTKLNSHIIQLFMEKLVVKWVPGRPFANSQSLLVK